MIDYQLANNMAASVLVFFIAVEVIEGVSGWVMLVIFQNIACVNVNVTKI